MLISVNQFRSWLRQSAITLREGGATATADIYEEIGEQLDAEAQRLADSDKEELREARQVAVRLIQPRSVSLLEKAGLMVVPSGWRQASCQSDPK